MENEENNLKVNVEIPFPSTRFAEVAYHSLRIDKEPKRSGVNKEVSFKDNILIANFSGRLARQLRVAIDGYFSKVALILETFEFLGPPVSEKYDHFY